MPHDEVLDAAAPSTGAAALVRARTRAAIALVALVLTAAAAGCASPTPAVTAAEEAAAIAQAEAETAAVAERAAAQIAQAQRDATIARLQAEAAQADAVQADAVQADRWRTLRVAAWNLLLAGVPLLLVAAAVAYVWSRRGLIWARKADGTLPVLRGGLTVDLAAATIAARHASELALASQQPVPQSLTWSPRSEYRNDVDVAGGELPALPVATHLPSFAELLSSGVIGAGKPLYLGTGAEGPLTGTWKSIYSAGVGGLQGSGKTFTGVALILQALLDGTAVRVIDPHAGDPDSLATRLGPVAGFLARPIASEDRDMLEVLNEVDAAIAARRRDGGADRQPWLLVIDEWTGIQRGEAAERVSPVVEAVTQEGRKMGVNALLLGQRWSATRGGGNDLRNTLTSAFVHRMRPEDARMLTGLRAEHLPKDMLQLAPGECYVQTTAGDFTRVQMPRMSDGDADAVQVATLLAASRPTSRPASGAASEGLPASGYRLPGGNAEDAGKPLDGAASGANDPLYGEVRALLIQGQTMSEIRDRIAGEPVKGGGRAFQAANARLTAILQSLALESAVQAPESDGEPSSS